ncbi:unnamed protein product [Merluccius merluccius]
MYRQKNIVSSVILFTIQDASQEQQGAGGSGIHAETRSSALLACYASTERTALHIQGPRAPEGRVYWDHAAPRESYKAVPYLQALARPPRRSSSPPFTYLSRAG